jgi:L-asparagine transporter-like permease
MKKEFGKWLMDIAKYITTAVILTSVIGGFEDKTTLYVFAFLVVAVTLGWGLYLVKDNTKKGK